MDLKQDVERYVFIKDTLLIIGLSLVLMIGGYFAQSASFQQSQAQFLLFAQQMLAHGVSFFPRDSLGFSPHYLSTMTFLTYLLSLPFGRVTGLALMLPTAIASGLIALLVYGLVVKYSRLWAWFSVLLLFANYAFVNAARSASPDQWVSLVTIAAIYIVAGVDELDNPRFPLFKLLGLFLLGFLFRGPVGLLIPALTLVGFYLIKRMPRQAIVLGFSAGLLLGVCGGMLLVVARIQGGANFEALIAHSELLVPLFGASYHFSYYFNHGLWWYCPPLVVALLGLIISLKDCWVERRSEQLLLLALMVGVGLVWLSQLVLVRHQHAFYLLSTAPMLAIIAGYSLANVSPRRGLLILAKIANGFFVWFPWIMVLLLLGLLLTGKPHVVQLVMPIVMAIIYCIASGVAILQRDRFLTNDLLKTLFPLLIYVLLISVVQLSLHEYFLK